VNNQYSVQNIGTPPVFYLKIRNIA